MRCLQVVCGVTQLYRSAVGTDDDVSWKQLQSSSFRELGCDGPAEVRAAAAIWRVMSPRGGDATLAQMLFGVKEAMLAARAPAGPGAGGAGAGGPGAEGLGEAYETFRGSCLRGAAAAMVLLLNADAERVSYEYVPGAELALLEVLHVYSGQTWLAVQSMPGLSPLHVGYLLSAVGGVAVGGMRPDALAALLRQQQRPVELTLVGVTDGVLGDARFAALLAERAVSRHDIDGSVLHSQMAATILLGCVLPRVSAISLRTGCRCWSRRHRHGPGRRPGAVRRLG